ncbi:MAG: methyltransferase domain-containing protein [Bacteroidia bacterium]
MGYMFKKRSDKKELLDEENIPKKNLFQNLSELNTINTLLGGHAVTIKAIKTFQIQAHTKTRIIDIGCGGGDNLRILARYARKNNLDVELIGIDLKSDCIEYAKQQCANYPEISFIQSDYRDLIQTGMEFDIAFACLFNHHLSNEENEKFFTWCYQHSKQGFFINDLHRNPLAYYSIKWLTRLFSKSYLVKNDAPLSVLRGFKKNELQSLLDKNNIPAISKWAWAFRYMVICKK